MFSQVHLEEQSNRVCSLELYILHHLVDCVVALPLSHGSVQKPQQNRLASHFEQPLKSTDCHPHTPLSKGPVGANRAKVRCLVLLCFSVTTPNMLVKA